MKYSKYALESTIFFSTCFYLIIISFNNTTYADTVSSSEPIAIQLNIDGGIGPAIHDYVHRGLKFAQEKKARIVILQMNTPGGLDKSMRGIIKDMLASPIPVVTYVAPSGSHAASAGTFILYASSIAAMAPGTNLGAAAPVNIGGTEKQPSSTSPSDQNDKLTSPSATKTTIEKKTTNDASAYIRSLAQLHDRNVKWAELAVRKAASLSAQEALAKNVIDLIASNTNELLNKIDGRQVKLQEKMIRLHTKNLTIQYYHPDWRTKFLSIITDPSVAYLLLMAGIWGLFLEFAYPGMIIPGVLGSIALLIGLYALQLLPINYAGLALMLLGIAFIIAEAFLPSFGILGLGGIVALAVGSIMLIDTNVAYFGISIPLIISICSITGLFFLIIVHLAVKSRYRPIVSGREKMIGNSGIIEQNYQGKLYVRIDGELWKIDNPQQFSSGQKVKVIAMKGLILTVQHHED